MISPRKLLLILINSAECAGYKNGVSMYTIKKHYQKQLEILGLKRKFDVDEHTLFDYLENLKDLLFINIRQVDYYKTFVLTKYGRCLSKHILQNDLGYIDRTLVINQFPIRKG